MEHRITLNGTWNWCDMESKEWHKGIVPGTVLTDMMDGGLIEDTYWRTNEYETRELSRRDYQYEREFEVPESFFSTELEVRSKIVPMTELNRPTAVDKPKFMSCIPMR